MSGPGEPPDELVCNDPDTHPSHFWQENHSGKTVWCPSHTDITKEET